jgi:4-hydroxybenzoate polyprenyltransferase
MHKFSLLVKESRPIGWILGPLVFLIGMTFSGSITITPVSIFQILMLSFPGCIFLYGMNDVHDYESDKLNPRKKVAGGWLDSKLEPEYHPYITRVSIFVVILMFLSSFLTLSTTNILAMVVLVASAHLYSAPPVRLKERPVVDSVSNGMIFFGTFLLGFSFGGSIFDLGMDIYLITACVVGIHAYTTIMDYEFDKNAGYKTTAVVFGERGTSLFVLFIFILTFCVAKLSPLIYPPTLNPFSSHHYWSYNYYYLAFGSLLFLITSVYPSRLMAALFSLVLTVAFIVMIITYLSVGLF